MRSGVAAVAAALLLAPGGASAATRHVSPQGTASGSCTRAAPCSIAWAVNGGGSAPGDEVVVARGTYTDQPMVVAKPLTITAVPGAPRPVLRTTAPGMPVLTVTEAGADTVVEHLALSAAAEGGAGVALDAASTLDDLAVSTAGGPCLRSAAVGVRIEDTRLTQRAPGTAPCLQTTGDDTAWDRVMVGARHTEVAAAFSGNGTLTDVTATGRLTGIELAGWPTAHRLTASGEDRGLALSGTTFVTDSVAVARRGGAAVAAGWGGHLLLNVTAWAAGAGSSGIRALPGAHVVVKNSIARGSAADLAADPGAALAVGHSNYRTGPGIEDLGANLSASPRFVDPAGRDFRLRRGSLAIDAGSYEFNSGGADRAGRFRWLGKRPDMGAYEYPSPRPRRRRVDTRRPRLGVVRLTSTSFRAARRGLAFVSARRRAAPAGTALVFVVSEDIDLVVLISRPRSTRSVGTLVHPATRGANRMAISGRLDGRPLRPGRYVMTVIARDVSQNLSRPRHLGFRVVR